MEYLVPIRNNVGENFSWLRPAVFGCLFSCAEISVTAITITEQVINDASALAHLFMALVNHFHRARGYYTARERENSNNSPKPHEKVSSYRC